MSSPWLFIRDYLARRGEASVYEMWREYRRLKRRLGERGCSYQTFCRYVWELRRLGLIRRVRVEPARGRGALRPTLPRAIYALSREAVDSPLWRDPHAALYGSHRRRGR